jgi:exonuclease SbcD
VASPGPRLLHTSDWHLGRVLHNHPLLEDQRSVLGQIIDHCRSTPYDALLISGDLFDRGLPSEEAIRLWSRFLKDLRAACPELPLLVIAGNHDSAARVAYAADALALARIHVRGGIDALLEPVELQGADGGRIQVWMIPFLWAGDLDGDGEGRIRTQEETLRAAVERIRPLQAGDALQVVMAHCFAHGGMASDSERTLIGTATEVDADLFASFDYVALGHLHRCQRVAGNGHYSGSPMPYSFSEAGDVKAMLAVACRRGEAPVVTPIPLAQPHPMHRIAGSFRDLLENPAFEPYQDSFLEITLDAQEAGANPFALLKRRFPFLLNLAYRNEDGPEQPNRVAGVQPGELLSDYRQFTAGLGLEAEALEARVALAGQLLAELQQQVAQ